ncbi:hypothetical protein BT96DRAFT_1003316 [Gymnopus androsaceus JB14]|uniref:F-box domain-containing protein n=1 Tax=Gymnopus androsaceus JB14 TaxID=1447944 RepID=A0A6A4GV70_9AGAR|nr:hypothetical protein BT96DRAFT_1003316 [Gymnopus androsaceus JB14]
MSRFVSNSRYGLNQATSPSFKCEYPKPRPRSLESQITGLKEQRACDSEAQIFALTRQKYAKLVEIASFRNILPPVRRVPLEILSVIFELAYLPKMEFFIPGATSSCTPTSFLLFVRLRKMSLVRLLDFQPRSALSIIGITKPWPELESGLIGVEAFYWMSNFAFSRSDSIIGCSGISQIVFPLFRLPCSTFIQLERVALAIFDGDDGVNLGYLYPNKIQTFFKSPRLYHVNIQGNAFTTSLLEVLALPTAQLTSLIVASISLVPDPAAYANTLYACNGLINLEIDLPVDDGFSANLSILLSALKTLKISCHKV